MRDFYSSGNRGGYAYGGWRSGCSSMEIPAPSRDEQKDMRKWNSRPAEEGTEKWNSRPAEGGMEKWNSLPAEEETRKWNSRPVEKGMEKWNSRPTEEGIGKWNSRPAEEADRGRQRSGMEIQKPVAWMEEEEEEEIAGKQPEKITGKPQFMKPYIRYDYEKIIGEEQEMEKDLRRLQSMYPEAVKEILPCIEEVCDKMEYEGSMMFDEHPDKNTVLRLSDEVYEKVGDVWPKEPVQEPDGVMSMQYREKKKEPLGDLIRVLLLGEMHHRRCRRRRCRPHMH